RVEGRVLRPALFDAAIFQVVGAAWMAAVSEPHGGDAFLPTGVEQIDVGPIERARTLTCHARLREVPRAGDATIVADLAAWDESGRLVLEARGVSARRAPRGAIARAMHGASDLLYRIDWRRADPVVPRPLAGTRWIVLGEASDVRAAVVDAVTRAGGAATPAMIDGTSASERVRMLLAEGRAEGPRRGVVLLSSAAAAAAAVPEQSHALAAVALATVQAVASATDAGAPLRLVVVTSGVVGSDLDGEG